MNFAYLPTFHIKLNLKTEAGYFHYHNFIIFLRKCFILTVANLAFELKCTVSIKYIGIS